MPPLLSHHFSLTRRESSRTHLWTTSDSVIVVRTIFRNLSMHFGNIPMHFLYSRTIDIRKTSSIYSPAGCTTKLLYLVFWRCGPLMNRAERRESRMNVQEVLTDYLREVVAMHGQPLPTLDEPLLEFEGGVIDSMNMWPLIVFVESRFDLKVENTDIIEENFQTLRALVKFIETKHSALHS